MSKVESITVKEEFYSNYDAHFNYYYGPIKGCDIKVTINPNLHVMPILTPSYFTFGKEIDILWPPYQRTSLLVTLKRHFWESDSRFKLRALKEKQNLEDKYRKWMGGHNKKHLLYGEK